MVSMSPAGTLDPTTTNGKAHRAVERAREAIPAIRGFIRARSMKAGRVTSAITGPGVSVKASITNLRDQYAPLGYDLPWETLDYIELLATYNPDMSQAIENIKMLANTGHTLMVGAPSKLQVRTVKNLLETKARLIRPNSGGIDGVIDKLMDQAATYGAMCGEWVLSDNLRDVVDFADINPKSIRFFWEEDEQRWTPYQKVKPEQAKQAEEKGQTVKNGCVKLNEITFIYYDFDAAPESPYGTPPFLAALQNIAIQRDLVFNMAQIVKKLGLLALMDLSIERLQKVPGETDEQYEARMSEYLEGYIEVAEDAARDGGMIHFDDATLQITSLSGNAAGATNIHKANEEMVFSGLKSMPSVQGRSYSTTETYAGVAYEIIIRNTRKFQQGAKRFIERGYWLMAQLNGLNPDSIRLQFNENKSLNRLQDASSEKQEILNAIMLWIIGALDQNGVVQRLGHSEPKISYDEIPETVLALLSAVSSSSNEDEGEGGGGGDSESTAGKRTMMEDDDEAELELA